MCDKLFVGYSRVDITPEQYTNLGGTGQDAKRMCDKVLERIYATCVAISDAQGNTILYCPVDLIHARRWFSDPVREAISQATGVPVGNIMINASHNHSGPSTSSPHLETVQIWGKYLSKQLIKCALEAMADRKEAQILAGQRQVPGMTFVRHYHMNDGTVAGPNSGSFASGAKAHITEADDQLQVIRFQRKDARDVVLVNWQCHATTGSGMDTFALQGDYIYSLRNHVEGLTGTHFAFFQGAAGNLVPNTKLPEEATYVMKDGEEIAVGKDTKLYGRAMAEHVVACLQENMVPLSGGPVGAVNRMYVGAVDHSDDHLAQQAEDALERFRQYPLSEKKEANRMMRESGFNSFLHAMGIARRAKLEDTLSMELWALRAGDIGFISAPYEMFCSSGKYIKEHSPFKMTFVVSCSNDSYDYMADDTTFQYDVYEVNTRRYGRGTAEQLAQNFVEMLTQLQ